MAGRGRGCTAAGRDMDHLSDLSDHRGVITDDEEEQMSSWVPSRWARHAQ